MEKDEKKGNFNPLKDMDKKDREELLSYAINETKKAYENVSIYDMKPITDNFIYLGLENVAESLTTERKKKK